MAKGQKNNIVIALLNTQKWRNKQDTLCKTLVLCTCITMKRFYIASFFLHNAEKAASTQDSNLVTNGVKIYWEISPLFFTGNLC